MFVLQRRFSALVATAAFGAGMFVPSTAFAAVPENISYKGVSAAFSNKGITKNIGYKGLSENIGYKGVPANIGYKGVPENIGYKGIPSVRGVVADSARSAPARLLYARNNYWLFIWAD